MLFHVEWRWNYAEIRSGADLWWFWDFENAFRLYLMILKELINFASMTPHRSAPGSPSKASELDLMMSKILTNFGTFMARNMMSNQTCSARPLPTCKTSIVVSATIFKANIQRWRPAAATTKEVTRPSAALPLSWLPLSRL